VFQLHGASMTGQVKYCKKLTRVQFQKFMAGQSPAVVVMEACGIAHHWAREMTALGHDVKLIAPQYVRPFVKRQKNDAADAEAIVIAAQRPEMRFVEPKSKEQQARAVLFRARERLVHQRTELVNALRAVLYEFGHAVPKGIGNIKRFDAILEEPHSDFPALVRDECRGLVKQIAEQTTRIDARTKTAKEMAATADTARRLQTMPPPAHANRRCRAAGGRPADRAGGIRPRDAKLQTRARLRRLAWACPPAAFFWRQGAVGARLQGRSNRYPPAADHRGDVAAELDGAQDDRRGILGWRGCWQGSHACWWQSRWPTRWRAGSGPCWRRMRTTGIRRRPRRHYQHVLQRPDPVKGVREGDDPNGHNDRTDLDRENQFLSYTNGHGSELMCPCAPSD
jgi:hypothetical protein